ncbi:4765_t:CDS:1, partial [Dentiscutata heterogama]
KLHEKNEIQYFELDTSNALTWDDKVEQNLQVLKDCTNMQTEENTEEEHVPTRISSEIAEVNKETSKQRHVLNDNCAENTDILLEESVAQPQSDKDKDKAKETSLARQEKT